MACDVFKPRLIARIYDEIDPAEARLLDEHLRECPACSEALRSLDRTRALLASGAGEVPAAPRVVVLAERSRWRPAAAFAAGLACAALIGAGGLAAGASWTRARAVPPATVAARPEAVPDALTRRLDAIESAIAASPATHPGAVTKHDLDASLRSLEKRINGSRAQDLDYVLGQLAAYERRTGASIGETRAALRYVALASNPNVSER